MLKLSEKNGVFASVFTAVILPFCHFHFSEDAASFLFNRFLAKKPQTAEHSKSKIE